LGLSNVSPHELRPIWRPEGAAVIGLFLGPNRDWPKHPPFPAHAPGPPRARMRERSRGVALHCTASAVARRAYGRDGTGPCRSLDPGLRAGVHASCRARRLYVIRRVERWIGRSASLALAGSQPVLINRRCALFVSCHHPPSTRSILRKHQRAPTTAQEAPHARWTNGPKTPEETTSTSGRWSPPRAHATGSKVAGQQRAGPLSVPRNPWRCWLVGG